MKSAERAARYHRLLRIAAAKEGGTDFVSAYTISSTGEAVVIAISTWQVGIRAIVSYVVEPDGVLTDGIGLRDAVTQLCEIANPLDIVINCAHPEHIASGLGGGGREAKLAGFVANASRRSHLQLDNATSFDDGNPDELSQQIADLWLSHPATHNLGGSRGIGERHTRKITERTAKIKGFI
ncbi:homocysteine S-methyltransferase family protein [Loktanella atrilutea]|uniref:homocysteine S-methyltransferase family protein n=1 Tax=Loktanella atrilutea TaxID=366533 RepID=UPI0009330778|nr:homocysteine S-methyltransferase family protein [Loktanella atrilutea]